MTRPPPAADPRPRTAAELRALLLWAARGLQPGGGFYAGKKLRVTAEYGGGAGETAVRPSREADGLEPPAALRDAGGPTAAVLAERFLSDKERTILRALATVGPGRTQEVLEAVAGEISRNEFFVLWGGLQVRRLVAEADGVYDFAAGWVRGLAE